MTRWFDKWSGLALLVAMQIADAGGGSGPGADPSGTGGDSPSPNDSAAPDEVVTDSDALAGDAGGAGDRHAAEQEDALEDLLADEVDQGARPLPEQMAAVRAANRKLKRRLAKAAGVLQQIGNANPTDVVEKSRAFDRLQHLANTNKPELFRMLGVTPELARSSSAAADLPPLNRRADTAASGDLIDLSKLPFDPTDGPVNQYFGELAKTVNALNRELTQLKGKATASEQRQAQAASEAQASHWETQLTTAAAKIADPGMRMLFQDAVIGAYRNRQQHGKSAEFVINHYMTKLGVSQQVRQQANDAMRARAAKTTASLSRQHVGAGQPASAQGNQRKTLSSIRERLEAEA